jgi:hypothetical protein
VKTTGKLSKEKSAVRYIRIWAPEICYTHIAAFYCSKLGGIQGELAVENVEFLKRINPRDFFDWNMGEKYSF